MFPFDVKEGIVGLNGPTAKTDKLSEMLYVSTFIFTEIKF